MPKLKYHSWFGASHQKRIGDADLSEVLRHCSTWEFPSYFLDVSLDVDFMQSSKSHVLIVALKIQNMHPKNSIKEVDKILYIVPYLAQIFTNILKTIRHSTEEARSPLLCPLSVQQQ